ncbi:hypothetical protein BDA96_02G077800 [Sorghum bicolor]|uniref:Uncharacterized protein n=1 Tax=Sorghum bicolor TaxID=4558 RepID=A0A921RKK5_SORBI|nr:hypothetical protein BDA96_02G077800 [Sorghum bicolor]
MCGSICPRGLGSASRRMSSGVWKPIPICYDGFEPPDTCTLLRFEISRIKNISLHDSAIDIRRKNQPIRVRDLCEKAKEILMEESNVQM